MTRVQLLKELAVPADSRMILLVVDGLGGLPDPVTGKTELETARTPNLDELAKRSSCGLLTPIGPGITSGSAPGHLALFGYDPVATPIGRGVLSAVGVDLELKPGDVACRINFATMAGGVITDRRAGRIPTEMCQRLCAVLQQGVRLPDAQVLVHPELQHRAVVVFRGEGLSPDLSDSDPQVAGKPALAVTALTPAAERTARLANAFVEQANQLLRDESPANTVLLRGFGQLPEIPTLQELYHVRGAVVAPYPMYRGLARLVGMVSLPAPGEIRAQFDTVARNLAEFDYFFIHVKAADAAGEDGNFERKVGVIEEVDWNIQRLVDLQPAVLAVTGDHSTPARLRAHSWHPVPLLLAGPHARHDGWIEKFGERDCARGSLGHLRAADLMGLMLAHALRLKKFGA